MKKKLVYVGAMLALPLLAGAQSDIAGLGDKIIGIINGTLVPLLFAVAFLVFLWGAFKFFILGATNGEAKEGGKDLMIYGIIGFAVMVSVWGLVNILTGSFGLDNTLNTPTGGVKAPL